MQCLFTYLSIHIYIVVVPLFRALRYETVSPNSSLSLLVLLQFKSKNCAYCVVCIAYIAGSRNHGHVQMIIKKRVKQLQLKLKKVIDFYAFKWVNIAVNANIVICISLNQTQEFSRTYFEYIFNA